MNIVKLNICIVTVLFVISSSGCGSSKEKSSVQNIEKDTSVVGTIYIAGNEPFTHVMLEDTIGITYVIIADSAVTAALWKQQGCLVCCTGIVQNVLQKRAVRLKEFAIIKER
ncbi:MAG TPA: hypothetical protein PK595_02795 [Bacteroidota bacterium]|nr:hypothetical protein [Bacteroidota bacterium]